MGSAWLTTGGAFLGALLGALVNLVVGEGKRRRDADTALLAWVTQLYGWVVDGTLNPEQASAMLEGRRMTPRWWKFNRRHAEGVDQVLDQLDEAFTPDPPPGVPPGSEEFRLDPAGGDSDGEG